MKDYQNDKYENFFLNLKASRDGLAKFGDFTVAAVAGPEVEAAISQEGPALAKALATFRADVVARRGQAGSSQTGTSAEETAFEKFKEFIQATDKKVLGGYLYDHADEHDTYYPDKLAGLTQAPVTERLTRLTAYTEALENSTDKTVRAQGTPARALLTTYEKAVVTKTKARSVLKETISDLGPAATALAEALWDVHTVALHVHRRQPRLARRYFDFASLPTRTAMRRKAITPKAF